MVIANHRSFGMPWRAAAVEPMSALVLHGLPTTSTRQSSAALRAMAVPWPVKMPPLMLSRSLRSMPSFRGTAPTSSAQFAPRKAVSVSEVQTTSSSSGKAQSSSSIRTPSRAGSAASSSSSWSATRVSGPNASPDAIRKRSA